MKKTGKTEQKVSITKPQLTAASVAQSFDGPQAKPATEKHLQKVEAQMTGFEESSLRWTKFAVFLSLLVAVVIFGQWREMKSARDLATDTARRQLRAYVLHASTAAVFSKDTYTVSIEFKNFGQTPAYNLTSVITPEIRTRMVDPYKQMVARGEQTDDTSTDLGSLQPWKVETTQTFVTDDAARIGGDKALYVWARVQYRDTFQRCQYTSMYLRSDGRISAKGDLAMVVVRSDSADPEAPCEDPGDRGSAKSAWPPRDRPIYVPEK
jgi:hypothetical protein